VLLIRRCIPEPEIFREMKRATGGAVVATWRSSFRADVRRFEYKPQDDTGALGGGVKCGWDVRSTEVR